jgi:hypothetical protein
MKLSRMSLAPLALAALALHAPAQDVGSHIDSLKIEGLAQTDADSFEDFAGRAVLIEFFAYW